MVPSRVITSLPTPCAVGAPRKALAPGLERRAAELFDDLALALEHDLKAARAAAERLVQFLATCPEPTELLRGGLAPWQQRRLEAYLEDNLATCIHLETLAQVLRLSVSHFCRAFKQTYGATPHDYLVQLRLERARRLMLVTHEPLCQIALACGLADQAHLSKLFRRRVGEAPSIWRRRHLRGQPATASSRKPSACREASR